MMFVASGSDTLSVASRATDCDQLQTASSLVFQKAGFLRGFSVSVVEKLVRRDFEA